MTSYILKNNPEDHDILLLEEKEAYTFTPKKTYKWVKKVTILDAEILSKVWTNKIDKEYEKLLKLVYGLVSEEDTTSGDVLEAYTEIDRIKKYVLSLKEKGLKEKIMEKYLKKLYILELELKKVHVIELTEEIELGKGR
mgnify:CR=1 FL=1